MQHSIFTHCWQCHTAQHTQNALLRFHCNNGYANARTMLHTRTLPVSPLHCTYHNPNNQHKQLCEAPTLTAPSCLLELDAVYFESGTDVSKEPAVSLVSSFLRSISTYIPNYTACCNVLQYTVHGYSVVWLMQSGAVATW